MLAALQLGLEALRVDAVVELAVGGGGGLGGGACWPASVEGAHERRVDAADGVAQALSARGYQLGAADQVGGLLARLLGGDVGVVLEALLALQRGELLLQRARGREGAQREGQGRRSARARGPQARWDGYPGRHGDADGAESPLAITHFCCHYLT